MVENALDELMVFVEGARRAKNTEREGKNERNRETETVTKREMETECAIEERERKKRTRWSRQNAVDAGL